MPNVRRPRKSLESKGKIVMAEEKTANMIKTNTREKDVERFFEGIDNKFDDKTSRKHENGDFF